MSFLELFSSYEEKWNDPEYIEELKSNFDINKTKDRINYIKGEKREKISRKNNPNIASQYLDGVYEFYPTFSPLKETNDLIDIQIHLSIKQSKDNKYDIYVRELDEPIYIKYDMDSYIINLWVPDIVLLVPSNNSIPFMDINKLFEGMPISKGAIEYKNGYEKPILDNWNKPTEISYFRKETEFYRIKDTRLMFGLFLSLEPELSSKLGSNNIEMYKEWSDRMRPKLPILSDILDRSLGNKAYSNLNSKPYWIFPSGNDTHATSILVVSKGNYIHEGCYYINTGDGVSDHKDSGGKKNVAAHYQTDNSSKLVKEWIQKSQNLKNRSFEYAYFNQKAVDEYPFLDTSKMSLNGTFKKDIQMKGSILEWIDWEIAKDKTLYSSVQTSGSCTFQCILQALFLICLDLKIEEEFVSVLKEIREDFVDREILEHKVEDFWIIHAINTIYNKNHILPIRLPKYENMENRLMNVKEPNSLDFGEGIKFFNETKKHVSDYETFLKYLSKIDEYFWKSRSIKLVELVISKLIPILKNLPENYVSDKDWLIWSNKFLKYVEFKSDKDRSEETESDEIKITKILVAHILNEKSINKWEISEDFRDKILRKPDRDWLDTQKGYIPMFEPYDIEPNDYTWVIFWANFPKMVPNRQEPSGEKYRLLLTGDGEYISLDDLFLKIYEKNNEIQRKRILEASGIRLILAKEDKKETYTIIYKNSNTPDFPSGIPDNHSYYIELINEIPIYPNPKETIKYMNSNQNVMKQIVENGFFSYKLNFEESREKLGNNIKMRELWYQNFSPLSIYLEELVSTPAFIVLVIVIAMSTFPNRLEDLRLRFKDKLKPINIDDDVAVWLYHELFNIKSEDPSNKTISNGTFPVGLDIKKNKGANQNKTKYTLTSCLEYVMSPERYAYFLKKFTTKNPIRGNRKLAKYYTDNENKFTIKDDKIMFGNEYLYDSVEDGYLQQLYSYNYFSFLMILFKDSIYFPEYDTRIIAKNGRYIFKIKDEEYDLVSEKNRFTMWVIPKKLNFLIKKGNSYLLYSFVGEINEMIYSGNTFSSKTSGEFIDLMIDHDSSAKSKLYVSTFHPSGLFFLNFETDHILYLCISAILNAWPSLIYIVPLVATYSDKKNILYQIILSIFRSHAAPVAYNHHWYDYLSCSSHKGWLGNRYNMDYKEIYSNVKYEVDFTYIREFHNNPDWETYKIKFLELYEETGIELEKYLNNFQPLFRISSSSELLLLIHKLSILYRLIETKDYTPDTMTSLYNQFSGYYGSRPISFLLQEIRSCYLISWDQYKLYTKLNNPRIIRQAVMGIGKSSTIIPLLIMDNGYGRLNIIQPTHLVNQAKSSLSGVFIFYNPSEASWEYESFRNSKLSINISDDTYIKKCILEDPYQFKNNNFIMDEFDSMYNPLTSEYNIPVEYTSHPLSENIPLNKMYLFNGQDLYINSKYDHFFARVDNGKIKVKSENKFDITSAKEINFISRYMRYIDLLILGKEEDIELDPILKNKLKSDFKSISENSVYLKNYGFDNKSVLAVPYRSLNTPAYGSEFSDVDIIVITTLLSLSYSGFQKQHYDALLNSNLLTEKDIALVYKRTITKEIRDILLEKIIPLSIKYSREKYNVSFMDLVDEKFAKDRYAFSGTLNLDLPKSLYPEYYFKGKEAWTGVNDLKSQDEQILKIITESKVIIKKTDKEVLEAYKNGFNCLIDPAVLFKNYTNLNVAKLLNPKGVYFHPITDTPMMANGDSFNSVLCQKEQNQCHFYYDQKHCVGIDVKQPTDMLGLCVVSDINTLTEISQAIFRMRKILFKTHNVVFAYIGNNDISNGKDLAKMLESNENKNLKLKSKSQILQELNVCRRHDNLYIKESYRVTNHYEPLDGEYKKWLIENYKKEFELTGLKNIDLDSNNMSTQEQLQQEQEQEQEQETSISMNVSDFNICLISKSLLKLKDYFQCYVMDGIIISNQIYDYNKNSKPRSIFGELTPREYHLGYIFVYEKNVCVLTSSELLHMKLEVRSLLRDIKENDNEGLKINYYFAKFIFGHRLTSDEQYLIMDIVKDNIIRVKQLMFILYTNCDLIIPNSWLKYYLYDTNFLNTEKGKYMLKDLSPKKLEFLYQKDNIEELILEKKNNTWEF